MVLEAQLPGIKAPGMVVRVEQTLAQSLEFPAEMMLFLAVQAVLTVAAVVARLITLYMAVVVE